MIDEKRTDYYRSKKESQESNESAAEFTAERSTAPYGLKLKNQTDLLDSNSHFNGLLLLLLLFFPIENNKFKTFIDALLEANENDPDFTDADIRDEVITMMFAVMIIRNFRLSLLLY